MSGEIVNFDLLKQIIGEDKESYASFFDLFKEQTDLDIADFKKYFGEKNLIEIAKTAHKLKSTYGSIGSVSAYDTLANLENSAKENEDFEKIGVLFSEYLEIHGKILVEFDNFLKT